MRGPLTTHFILDVLPEQTGRWIGPFKTYSHAEWWGQRNLHGEGWWMYLGSVARRLGMQLDQVIEPEEAK